jgi:hypothetical protein
MSVSEFEKISGASGGVISKQNHVYRRMLTSSTDYPGSSAQANLHHTGQPPLPPAPAGYQHDGYGRLIPIPPTGQPYSGTQYAQTDHYAAVRGGYEAPNAAGYPNYRTEAPREYNTGAYQPSGYPPAPQYGGSSSQPGSLPPGYYWDARLQRALPYPSS